MPPRVREHLRAVLREHLTGGGQQGVGRRG
jgi:hypothetical protein